MSKHISKRTVEEIQTIELADFTYRPSAGMMWVVFADVTTINGKQIASRNHGPMDVPTSELESRLPGLLKKLTDTLEAIREEREQAIRKAEAEAKAKADAEKKKREEDENAAAAKEAKGDPE